MGGLSKRAAQIHNHTGADNKPSLILDSGNLLFKTPRLSPNVVDTARVNAAGILQSYRAMEADIINVGSRDLANGIDILKHSQQTDKLTWLSANILTEATNDHIFQPYIIREVAGLNIAVIGLTDHIQATGKAGSHTIVPWQEILPDLVREAALRTDMVILLSSYPLRANKEIAAAYNTIHIIFQSGHTSGNLGPIQLNNTLICQTASRGKYLGILNLQWLDSGKWQQDTQQQTAEINQQLTRVEAQIRRRKSQVQTDSSTEDQELKRLQEVKISLLTKRKTLLTDTAGKNELRSSYSNRFIALRPSLPDHAEVREIVSGTKRKMNLKKIR